MLFPMVYHLIEVGIWEFWGMGSYLFFWGRYIQDVYTIGKSISYFLILGLVVHEILKIRKEFWDRLFMNLI